MSDSSTATLLISFNIHIAILTRLFAYAYLEEVLLTQHLVTLLVFESQFLEREEAVDTSLLQEQQRPASRLTTSFKQLVARLRGYNLLLGNSLLK